MENARLEKVIQAIYDHVSSRLPFDQRCDCLALYCLASVLVAVKMAGNERISVDLGLVDGEEWECECKGD